MRVQLPQSTFLIILAFSAIHVSQAYVGHNQTCDQSASATACDPNMDLSCRNSKCECINVDYMEWNESKQKCVVLVGRSCLKSQGSSFSCVDDAYCQWNVGGRVCVCNSQRSPTESGHCKLSHGATCDDSKNDCNTEDKLICSMDQCRCPSPLNHIFKEKRNTCFIKVGAPCTPNPGPNAVTCDPEENECLADLESTTGYSCQCLAGNHMEHFARQCVRGNLQSCSSSGELSHPPCDYVAGLGCNFMKDGICECILQPDQAWDEKQMACGVLEGRGCALHTPDDSWYFGFGEFYFQCFDGLECVALDGHEFEGICRKKKTTHGNATIHV